MSFPRYPAYKDRLVRSGYMRCQIIGMLRQLSDLGG